MAKQLHDHQSQVKEAIGQIENRIKNVQERIEEYNEDIDALNAELHEKNKKLDDINRNIDGFVQNIDQSSGQIHENEAHIAENAQQIGEPHRQAVGDGPGQRAPQLHHRRHGQQRTLQRGLPKSVQTDRSSQVAKYALWLEDHAQKKLDVYYKYKLLGSPTASFPDSIPDSCLFCNRFLKIEGKNKNCPRNLPLLCFLLRLFSQCLFSFPGISAIIYKKAIG